MLFRSPFLFDPVFGLDVYSAIGNSHITLNKAIDMAGNDRGNMRCFEAMSTGTMLLSDSGNYPRGFEPGLNFETFGSAEEAIKKVKYYGANVAEREKIAESGQKMISALYNKERQWQAFQTLAH